jgi:hypothetical protein
MDPHGCVDRLNGVLDTYDIDETLTDLISQPVFCDGSVLVRIKMAGGTFKVHRTQAPFISTLVVRVGVAQKLAHLFAYLRDKGWANADELLSLGCLQRDHSLSDTPPQARGDDRDDFIYLVCDGHRQPDVYAIGVGTYQLI